MLECICGLEKSYHYRNVMRNSPICDKYQTQSAKVRPCHDYGRMKTTSTIPKDTYVCYKLAVGISLLWIRVNQDKPGATVAGS